MMTVVKRFPGCFSCVLGIAVLALGTNPASAQFGMGMGMGGMGGMGMMMGIGTHTSAATSMVNERSLIQSARGIQPRPSISPYANNGNGYINRVRDNGYVPRFDVTRRQGSNTRPGPSVSTAAVSPAAVQPAATVAAAARPVVPLASFFDAARNLVWPQEAPTNGDLKAKRDASDQYTLLVLDESKDNSVASISTVTKARQKLLEYGRPALQEIRANATPRIADVFHLFLLSLYESLAQAALPPEASPAP